MPLTPSEVRTVIIGAMLALFLSALDQTITATALPSIAADLGDFSLISWVITAYLLTSTCATPVFGKLSDLYGRRIMLRVCVLTFMAASVLCALAPTMPLLILARAIQGIGGGGLITLAQTTVADVVSPRERGRYSAYFSGVWAASALMGPTVGGLLTEHWGWPWIFWINLPLGAIALVVADRALKKLPVSKRKATLDITSIVLLCGGSIALLLVLSLGGKRLPWLSLQLLALGAIAIVLLALFIRQQGRSPEPILPPRFLTGGVVAPVLASIAIVYGSYLAIAVLAPIYFQVALGAPITEAGLLMIPIMLSSTVTAGIAGRYTRWAGRCKLPPLIGLPVAISTLGLLAFLAPQISPATASVILMVAGLGIGPSFPCSMVAAQNAVERGDLGAVSGAIAFSRALGGAMATALASALVLGLVSAGLPDTGHASSLEDLARQTLGPNERAVIASAFGVMFGAVAAALACGLAFFAMIQDRPLQEASGLERAAAD